MMISVFFLLGINLCASKRLWFDFQIILFHKWVLTHTHTNNWYDFGSLDGAKYERREKNKRYRELHAHTHTHTDTGIRPPAVMTSEKQSQKIEEWITMLSRTGDDGKKMNTNSLTRFSRTQFFFLDLVRFKMSILRRILYHSIANYYYWALVAHTQHEESRIFTLITLFFLPLFDLNAMIHTAHSTYKYRCTADDSWSRFAFAAVVSSLALTCTNIVTQQALTQRCS